MAKKYSVQMEDDKIVSVEVDGVAYTNPDEIPDEQDREKIQTLINRTMDPDSDEEFDREFKKEFRDMERQSSMFPKLLLAIFLGVAAITLTICAFSTVQTVRALSREQSAPGQVVDMVQRTSRDTSTGEVTTYSYPVVAFAPDGQPVRNVQLSEGSSPPSYTIGDQVTIQYNPQQPRDARIKSFSSNLLMWILPGVTFLVGAAFLAAALMVFKFFPPNQKETVPKDPFKV